MSTDLRDRVKHAAPEPDLPLDVDELVRWGQRIRRNRLVATVAASLVVVVAAAVGAAQVFDREPVPFIEGDRPEDDAENAAVLSLSGAKGEGWLIEVHPVADGWCLRVLIGTERSSDDRTQPRCDEIGSAELPIELLGLTRGQEQMAWGLSRPPVERIVATWPNGEQTEASVSSSDDVPFDLWVIAYAGAGPETLFGYDASGEPIVQESWTDLTGIGQARPAPSSDPQCQEPQDHVSGSVDPVESPSSGDPEALVRQFYDASLDPSDEVWFDGQAESAIVLRGERVVANARLRPIEGGQWVVESWAACPDLRPEY